ncbi:hypothetical protein FHS29_007331 [Saccharothrix tamanrassetensis]|uniref:Uncharacterized protein n=1 Tax=Saccharothrix tamanrassetensis TaxID=1051531 RepID=A0A841CV49_9PSEU|nr:hypothetical protein [Saccharothrix tamanrassetensis]MBB5960703.1 hypothetical protein [Saccharothrix tamanrassetensis]
MNLASKIAIGVVAAALLGAGLMWFGGALSSGGDTHPPCEQLPTAAEATSGLSSNQALVDEIKALGKSTSVNVGKPCPAGQDRALIEVTYRSDSERDAISNLLGSRNGFGVPVYLVKG